MRLRVCLWLILALTLTGACKDGRKSDQAVLSSEYESRTQEQEDEARKPDEAFANANDLVERARIMALPLEPLPSELIQGVALPLYAELPDLSYEAMLQKIVDVGASHVSIVVFWNQKTIYHNTIAPDADEMPPDARLGELFEAAHAAGLKVMLFPIVHVELRNEGEWRGKLAPTKPERWQAEYREFILHYARLAARHDVEIYSVGSELSSMESEHDFWSALIADVRDVFSGKLIYSSNWDHYRTPRFWEELDYIGVSAYFEIARRNDEPIHLMSRRWRSFRDELLAFAKKRQKPLVLTEVGYPSIDSSAVRPWDYTARTAPNQNAQLAAFRSLSETWTLDDGTRDAFGGLYIWHGWGPGGDEDLSYSIWDKNAYDLVRDWYAR